MTELERVLVNRDNMTESEAKEERDKAQEMFYEMMADGSSYDDVEEMMEELFGLEMDYIFDIM